MSDPREQPSEYLEYLPALFRDAAVDSFGRQGALPGLLKAFEKILTGVKTADGNEDPQVQITTEGPGGTRTYEPLETVIDQLDRCFDPFRTDHRFLVWLASWVALELRTDWTRAEQRKMIARMVQLSRRIGLKAGLFDFLDIYAREAVRPRVSIDDDEALIRIMLRDNQPGDAHVLAFAQIFKNGEDRTPILYRPSAIAVMADDDLEKVRYVVADAGLPGATYPSWLQPSLWLLKPNGELDEIHWSSNEGGTRPIPRPINRESVTHEDVVADKSKDYQLIMPVAVAVENRDRILVLEQGYNYGSVEAKPRIFRYTLNRDRNAALKSTRVRLAAMDGSYPIDMVLFRENDVAKLAILEREGADAGSFLLRIVKVDDPGTSLRTVNLGDPSQVKEAPVTPTAIAYETPGNWIIADARDDDRGLPGTLLRLQVADTTETLTDLLPSDPQRNSLVYPTGVAVRVEGEFVVADRGVKMSAPEGRTFCRTMAEPANVFRVECNPKPGEPAGNSAQPQITRLVGRGLLSWPAKLAIEPGGAILVADQGESEAELLKSGDKNAPMWRGRPHRLGVSVLFAAPRLDPAILKSDEDLSEEEQRRKQKSSEAVYSASRGIEDVINDHKPLHSIQLWKRY